MSFLKNFLEEADQSSTLISPIPIGLGSHLQLIMKFGPFLPQYDDVFSDP